MSNKSKTKIFAVWVIVGVAVTMVVNVVFLEEENGLSSLLLSPDLQTINDETPVSLINNQVSLKDSDISLFNSIKSPSNQIPAHLDASTKQHRI